MFSISDDLLAERRKWEIRYLTGDITLVDYLDICMELGVPISKIGRDKFNEALNAYFDGRVSDLAEAFGIAMKKREKNREKHKTLVSHVRFHVDAEHKNGHSLQNPAHYDGTAFHAAAKYLGFSPTYLHDLYYGK